VTGTQLGQFDRHREPVYSADFSPDGRFIVTASAGKAARVWDAATGEELGKLRGHTRGLRDAAFSRDGNYIVTGADDGMIGLWKASTRDRLALLPLHSSSVTSVQFSSNSRFILSISQQRPTSQDRIARIYDCEICAPFGVLRDLAEERQRYVPGRALTLQF
jgi:WD40 repeat protein